MSGIVLEYNTFERELVIKMADIVFARNRKVGHSAGAAQQVDERPHAYVNTHKQIKARVACCTAELSGTKSSDATQTLSEIRMRVEVMMSLRRPKRSIV